MAVNAYTRISAANFNTLQNKVSRLLGDGSGQTGYGQTLNSAPVAAESIVYASDMNQLLLDINRISIHQAGSATALSAVTQSSTVKANEVNVGDNDGFNQYLTEVERLEGDAGVVDGTQITIETLDSDTRFSPWNGQLAHSFTLTFSTTDHRRAFFNAGGQVYISAQIESPGDGPWKAKADDWKTMLNNMGTIQFKANTTSKTGFGGTLFPIAPNTAIGNYQLTAGLQTLFERLGNDNYAENRYLIFAKEVSNKAIQFVIQFQDQDVGDPNVDESIPGILVSKVQLRRPTGSYVNVPAPSYSMQSSLEVGD
jgi:hypothetical protein|tara:strand:- start:171 stop:1103 length:933 start_codon:yes stop_codon:yes gene_type:complete